MDKRLPPGLKFHPTDKELLSFYLRKKKNGKEGDRRIAICHLDVYDHEPWDLPSFSIRQLLARMSASLSTQEEGSHDVKEVVEVEDEEEDDEGEEDGEEEESEKDCYVFHTLDRKYHRGSRSNRATRRGYWKATGKVKKVLSSSPSRQGKLLGTKKTLVFYQGRAPHGERTDWVMHEYQLAEEEEEHENNERTLVLCRIRKKSRPVETTSPDENPISNTSPPCNADIGNAEGNVGIDRLGFRSSSSSSSSLPPHTNSSRNMSGKYQVKMMCRHPNPEHVSIHHHSYTPFLSL